MRQFLIVCSFLVPIISFCQKGDVNLAASEKVLGKNLISNSEIKGVETQFPERIHSFFYDSLSGYITIQTRGLSKNGRFLNKKGSIAQYDVVNNAIKWTKEINYQTTSLKKYKGNLILTKGNKNIFLDFETGEELSKIKHNFYYIDPEHHFAIGYKYGEQTSFANYLEAIDLQNEQMIWKTALDREYGWNDLIYTNDSTLLIVASGIHSINIKDGVNWKHELKTGYKDKLGATLITVGGVAMGIMSGIGGMATANAVYGIVSNVLIEDPYLYIASKEEISCIELETGELKWTSPIDKKLTSKSSIYFKDSLIIMINHGYAKLGNRKIKFGKPFIASFSKETGRQNFFSTLDSDNSILEYKLIENDIYLMFANKIAKYSIDGGALISEKTLATEEYGENLNFLGKHIFKSNSEGLHLNLTKTDSTMLYVYTNQNKVLIIDQEYTIADVIELNTLSQNHLQYNNYKFLKKVNSTIVINEKGEKVAEIEVSSDALLIDKTIYYSKNDLLLSIDLSNVLVD